MPFKSLRRIIFLLLILGLSLVATQPASGSTSLPMPNRAEPAALASISGVVTDGGVPGFGAHGYPMYAQIHITAPSYDQTVFTDPITGAYSIELEEGIEYTFTIDAFPPGYQTLVQMLTPTGSSLTQNFSLLVDPLSCDAPGYQQDYDFYYDFEDSNHGFSPGGITSFEWGTFTSGPLNGHSGSKGIATNLSGAYSPDETGYILSPLMDLSAYGDKPVILQWWDWKEIEQLPYDSARVEATLDGGGTWDIIWGPVGGMQDTAYHQQTVILDPIYNVNNFQFRFFFESDYSNQYDGWYIDDIGILPLEAIAIVSADFDTGDNGFTVSGTNPSWQHGIPDSGPNSANSPPNVWGTNLSGNYNSNESSWLTSPTIDLSAYTGQIPILSFYQWNDIEHVDFDWGAVEVTRDNGSTWQDASGKIGDIDSWSSKVIVLDSTYAVSNFRFRFYFHSDSSANYAGWYIDDLTLSVTESSVFGAQCTPSPGGVAAGFIYDENTGLPLLGADVLSPTNSTQSTQWESNQDNAGLYWFFEPTQTDPESVGIEASLPLYKSQLISLDVIQSEINHRDFYLSAGDLNFDPAEFTIPMTIGDPPEDHTLRIDNTGGKDANVSLSTVDLGYNLPLDQQSPISRSISEGDEFPYQTSGPFAVKPPPVEKLVFRNSEPDWLSLNPTSGTILAESPQDITLTLDPTSLGQPGEYHSEILIEHDTPYTYDNIPVTLLLAAPSDWVRVKGTVNGLEKCDLNPAALAGATVSFWQGEVLAGSIETTETGYYTYSLPNGTYDMLVSIMGYSEILLEDVDLGAGMTITQDFYLRLLAPCLSVEPTSLEQTIITNQSTTQTLILKNSGAAEASINMLEAAVDQDAMILYESFESEGILPDDWDTVHQGTTNQRWTTTNDSTKVYEGDYAAWIRYDDFFSSDEWLLSPIIDTALLTDLKISFLAFSDTNYPGATMKLWVTDESGTPLTASPLWDLIRDESWPDLDYRVIVIPLDDFDQYGNIRLAWQYVGLDGQSFALDLVQLTGSKDITWLSTDPTSSVVPPDDEIEITVGFDAADLEPGDYYAKLNVNAPPDPLINIPITIHVELGMAPFVKDIPDQTIFSGESFAQISLDQYVLNKNHPVDQISWSFDGNSDLSVSIDGNRVATITPPVEWTGTETITFTATNPDGYSDSDTVIFTVTPRNIFLPLILR